MVFVVPVDQTKKKPLSPIALDASQQGETFYIINDSELQEGDIVNQVTIYIYSYGI